MFGARCTKVPARARPVAEGLDQAVERQALGLGEGHRLGHRLDDAGAHDLVGGLGGLARAAPPEMRDRAAHGREHRTGAFERLGGTADHDRELAVARALDAAAHRCVEELDPLCREATRGLARGVGGDGRAIHHDRARAQPGASASTTRGRRHRRRRRAPRRRNGPRDRRDSRRRGRQAPPPIRPSWRRCGSRRPGAGRLGAGCGPCRAPWRRGR